MAAKDILAAASAVFPMWDGRSMPVTGPVFGTNNGTGKTLLRIINSYDSGTIISPNTELAQGLAIGPNPVVTNASTYLATVSTLFLLDCSANAINVTMPPDPYPGMVMIFKDSTASAAVHTVTITANTSQMVEEGSAPGTYNTSSPNTATGFSCTYVWNPITHHWDLIAYVS